MPVGADTVAGAVGAATVAGAVAAGAGAALGGTGAGGVVRNGTGAGVPPLAALAPGSPGGIAVVSSGSDEDETTGSVVAMSFTIR